MVPPCTIGRRILAPYLLCSAFAGCTSQTLASPLGDYEVKFESYQNEGLEPLSTITSRTFEVFAPSNGPVGDQFPLLVFAHGGAAGGIVEGIYRKHLMDVASFGFVIIAPLSCFLGCTGPVEPKAGKCFPRWPSFVHENTRAIEYARNQSAAGVAWAGKIAWRAGVGVFGHSMGGEALVQLAGKPFQSEYNVKAMVCEHCFPCIKTGAPVNTPAMFFTGDEDDIVTAQQVKAAYIADAARPKTYANAKGRGHLEMTNLPFSYNPAVSTQTAAFMKVWLTGDRGHFHDIVYGDGPDSVCGYASMVECQHDMGNVTEALSMLV